MKNYNKILEAVNRGIQLALDDFDDDGVQNIKSKQTQNRDYTKEYLDLMNEVVDLGLPSGTLWCKYNLGVDPNQLSKAKGWYGKYYAWGELEANKTNKDNKIHFNWVNYKYSGKYPYLAKMTKYCNKKENGVKRINNNENYPYTQFADNLTQLLPEDDAAYQNKKLHNYKFHIPTKEQCEELINYTNNYWVKNYGPNKTIHNLESNRGIQGLNGRIFEGKNGNQLFIPAAGCYTNSDINWIGTTCNLWSSSLDLNTPYTAYYLFFISNNINIYHSCDRCAGLPIRPVINL